MGSRFPIAWVYKSRLADVDAERTPLVRFEEVWRRQDWLKTFGLGDGTLQRPQDPDEIEVQVSAVDHHA